MIPFDFQLRTRIVFGSGGLDQLGALAGELGARSALLVTDPGIILAGHVQRALVSLHRASIETHVFDGVRENPDTDVVAAGLAIAQRYEPELLIGIGGGSSMDAAKGINFLHTNGGQMQDYWGTGKATRPMLPMIAIPTTAGTGSETQSFALISDAKTHAKMACGDKKASFRVAILDPELTISQPARVTALTGIDAMAHALESYVTTSRNPASLAFSREAWLLLAGNFKQVIDAPHDLAARAGMLLGASFAGVAIENSMLGVAHALANPLTTSFGTPHGEAVGLMLPHVIRFNGETVGNLYQELLEGTGGGAEFPDPRKGYEGLAEFVAGQLELAGLATQLRTLGVPRESLASLATSAAKQWTASFNPRPVDEASLARLYEQAW
jgi:alcohol dehydrogenase